MQYWPNTVPVEVGAEANSDRGHLIFMPRTTRQPYIGLSDSEILRLSDSQTSRVSDFQILTQVWIYPGVNLPRFDLLGFLFRWPVRVCLEHFLDEFDSITDLEEMMVGHEVQAQRFITIVKFCIRCCWLFTGKCCYFMLLQLVVFACLVGCGGASSVRTRSTAEVSLRLSQAPSTARL